MQSKRRGTQHFQLKGLKLAKLSVMIHPVTNCMERKKHGNQMIVLSVFVVTARQNALQQYAAIQTVKTLFISGDSVVLYAP